MDQIMKKKITWNDVMDFDLVTSPVIFDLGGYKGDWVKEALNRFSNPQIYVFEPVKEFYEHIKSRYQSYKNVKVYNFGLSADDQALEISVNGNKSSFMHDGNKEVVRVINIKNFLIEENIFHVDLIKINIEGAEYELLEYLTKQPEITIFKNYLIQFHPFVDNYQVKKEDICNRLSQYFDRKFNYEMVFEGWTIKKLQPIHCIGDSHISVFAKQDRLIPVNNIVHQDNFIICRAGPVLAYNISTKKNISKLLKQIDDTANIIFCFGEIDCRAQVHRFSNNKKTYEEVIDEIVTRYTDFAKQVQYNRRIIFFSITPELVENPHHYYYKDHPDVFDSPKGSFEERVSYKKYFNKKLEQTCSTNGWKYISIYDYVDEMNKISPVFRLDDIHLNGKNVFYLIEYELIKHQFANTSQPS